MIDGFEARLADLIADRLISTTEIASVTRLHDGVPDDSASGPVAAVAVLSAEPDQELGDDKLEVFGARGSRELRPVLRLSGEVLVRLALTATATADDRAAIVRALDRLLLTLHDASVRDGTAFDTDEDQGFALDGGFRLARVNALPVESALAPDQHRFDVIYSFAGRFWPVQAPVAGPAIAHVPTRTVVLPMQLPIGLSTRAGSAALAIEVPVDIRAWDGAPPALAARLKGAAPPGSLQGDATELPLGFVRVPVVDGRARLSYAPPASLARATQVSIDICYAGPGSALPVLSTLRVGVLP